MRIRPLLAAAALVALAACGDDSSTSSELVEPSVAAEILADPPDDLVILDVRTQEEFDEGYVEGAAMLDFYSADFAEQLAELDRDVPYVVYCRSGNRSGQTVEMMDELGFENVTDVDGGIVAWSDAGLPVVIP